MVLLDDAQSVNVATLSTYVLVGEWSFSQKVCKGVYINIFYDGHDVRAKDGN